MMFTQNTAVFSATSTRGIRSPLLLAFCLLFCAIPDSTASTLESNSPFLPDGYGKAKPKPKPKAAAPTSNGPLAKQLEFRGVVELQGTYQFSLFDKKDNRGYWIAENSSEEGISVSNFERDKMRLTVSLNGRTEQLTMLNPQDKPMPVVRNMPISTKPAKKPNIPGIQSKEGKQPAKTRSVPRRRVILPKNSVGY